MQVLQRGVITFEKKKCFRKSLFLPIHIFCFAPLQVLVAELSYRRGFVENLGVDDTFDGIILTLSYCTNLMLCHCV